MEIYTILKLLGIVTYIFVFITALTGLLKVKIKNHKLLAIIAVLLASLHGILVFLVSKGLIGG
jgi:hypothetical protein